MNQHYLAWEGNDSVGIHVLQSLKAIVRCGLRHTCSSVETEPMRQSFPHPGRVEESINFSSQNLSASMTSSCCPSTLVHAQSHTHAHTDSIAEQKAFSSPNTFFFSVLFVLFSLLGMFSIPSLIVKVACMITQPKSKQSSLTYGMG